jgi:type IV pilus assembly protein PilM
MVIGALVYGWFNIQDVKTDTSNLRSDLTVAENQVATELPTIPPLKEQITQIQGAIPPIESTTTGLYSTFESLRQNRYIVIDDIREALDLDGDITQLYLTNIDHDGTSFILQGTATDEGYIFQYARQLRTTGRFEVVIVSSITSEVPVVEEVEQPEVFNFTLTLL